MLEKYLKVPAPGHVPVLQIGPLTVMKLIARRYKDIADLVELFKRQPTDHLRIVREFVMENLPSQVSMFDEVVACAEAERSQDPRGKTPCHST